jgi:hypothetical protein
MPAWSKERMVVQVARMLDLPVELMVLVVTRPKGGAYTCRLSGGPAAR